MIRREFFQRLVAGACALVLVPVTAHAESTAQRRKKKPAAAPTPSPTGTPDPTGAPSESPTASPGKSQEVARLRLWKAADVPNQPLRFQLFTSGKPDAKGLSPIKLTADAYQFSGYVDVPAGSLVAEFSATDRPTVRLPLQLVAGGQSTVLVRLKGATITAEWIDDTLPAPDSEGEFSAFNLLSASGDVQIDLGSILTVHLPAVHSSLRLSGIKRASYPVFISGTDGTGKSFRWNTDADFRQSRKATLLIYPDNYGRIRPRVVVN